MEYLSLREQPFASDMRQTKLMFNSELRRLDDAAVLLMMVEGNNPAFTELYERYAPRLSRYLARQIGTGAPVEDIAQELWERVIGLRRKPPAKLKEGAQNGEFKTQAFLYRIARNLCIDHQRARREVRSLDHLTEAEHPKVDARASRPDAEELVALALDALSPEFREVLVLNLYCGYRFDEIAVMLEKSPDAIWARASRARAKLRKAVVELAEREGVSLENYIAGNDTKKVR